jgi:hypothetical protein
LGFFCETFKVSVACDSPDFPIFDQFLNILKGNVHKDHNFIFIFFVRDLFFLFFWNEIDNKTSNYARISFVICVDLEISITGAPGLFLLDFIF